MHFDDRLATVLRLPATSRTMGRIQFRQLVDLLGQETVASAAVDAAFERLEYLAQLIPARERAAILAEPMMRLRNPELVVHLILSEPEVASAAVGAAELAEADWLDLIPALPVRARGILRHRRGLGAKVDALLDRLGIADRGLPPAARTPGIAAERPARPELVVLEGGAARRKPAAEPGAAGIGAIVRRIEAFRQSRSAPLDGESEALQSPSAHVAARAAVLACDFSTDSQGRVDWAEGPLAPGLVGSHLPALFGAPFTDRVRRTVRGRLPLAECDCELTGAPMLTGRWRLDALPQFDGQHGRFIGYAGRMRRMARETAQSPPDNGGDSMRQVLHELRTPANAIQIAAEIIQQQLYGPAPHEYRALAAAIAGDTAQILAGFDELDRLVKLESGAIAAATGECDFGAVVTDTVARLRSWTDPRGSRFAFNEPAPHLPVRLEREEAARLAWRLLAALAGAAAEGETMTLSLESESDTVELAITVPDTLAERIDAARPASEQSEPARALSAGMFGIGFTLRLAGAEARAAGGHLQRTGGTFRLSLPGLTLAAASHTQA